MNWFASARCPLFSSGAGGCTRTVCTHAARRTFQIPSSEQQSWLHAPLLHHVAGSLTREALALAAEMHQADASADACNAAEGTIEEAPRSQQDYAQLPASASWQLDAVDLQRVLSSPDIAGRSSAPCVRPRSCGLRPKAGLQTMPNFSTPANDRAWLDASGAYDAFWASKISPCTGCNVMKPQLRGGFPLLQNLLKNM